MYANQLRWAQRMCEVANILNFNLVDALRMEWPDTAWANLERENNLDILSDTVNGSGDILANFTRPGAAAGMFVGNLKCFGFQMTDWRLKILNGCAYDGDWRFDIAHATSGGIAKSFWTNHSRRMFTNSKEPKIWGGNRCG